MKHIIRRALVAVAAGALIVSGWASPAKADTIPPVKRVSCPSVAQVNAISPTIKATKLDRTVATCDYSNAGGERVVFFSFDDRATTPAQWLANANQDLADAGSSIRLEPIPAPTLGAGAFLYGDASPLNAVWSPSPGTVAFLGTPIWDDQAAVIRLAKLFKPMMEIYTIPGERTVNGRKWRTTCEAYSATVRCRTEIFATLIHYAGGKYVRTDGWAFNSLTYRWAPRSLWAGNPLAKTGSWTATDGRQWRTECDTTATGRNACRSYAMVDAITWTGTKYQRVRIWVFNNQVLFD